MPDRPVLFQLEFALSGIKVVLRDLFAIHGNPGLTEKSLRWCECLAEMSTMA